MFTRPSHQDILTIAAREAIASSSGRNLKDSVIIMIFVPPIRPNEWIEKQKLQDKSFADIVKTNQLTNTRDAQASFRYSDRCICCDDSYRPMPSAMQHRTRAIYLAGSRSKTNYPRELCDIIFFSSTFLSPLADC